MSSRLAIDPEFYEEFARRCRERGRRLAEAMTEATRADSEDQYGAALVQVSRELHDAAGEAAMLGLPGVASAALAVSRSLRVVSAADRELCAWVSVWLERWVRATVDCVRGAERGTELETLRQEVGEGGRPPRAQRAPYLSA